MNDLGVMYAKGEGAPKSFESAAEWYLKATEFHLAAAQKNLAVLYRKGFGVALDRAEARRWYALAAAQGSADATTALAEMDAEDALGIA
jgi:TPR repeat protein